MENICTTCGKSFRVNPAREKTAKYCSNACRGVNRKSVSKTMICRYCKKEYKKYPSQANRSGYCSRVCLGKARITALNETRRSPKEYAVPPVRHGKDNNKYVPAIEKECKNCGNIFFRKPWQLNSRGVTGEFCSPYCMGDYRKKNQSGENSPLWVGGITTYRGKGWKDAREMAIQRDRGVCQKCGVYKGNSIPVHHIKPFREFDSIHEANSLENLVCLCQSCHMKSEPRKKKDTAVS